MAEERKKSRRSFRSLPRRAQNAAFASMRASGKIKSKTKSKSKGGGNKKDYASLVKEHTSSNKKERIFTIEGVSRTFSKKSNAIKYLKHKGRQMPETKYEPIYRKGKVIGHKKVNLHELFTYEKVLGR